MNARTWTLLVPMASWLLPLELGLASGQVITPTWNGLPVDNCLVWANQCGWPAAHELCKKKGFADGAKSYTLSEPLPETIIISSGKRCVPSRSPTGKCVGFSRIECRGKAVGKTTVAPSVAGIPIDNCLVWANQCGWPAAHEYCKRGGFAKARSYTLSGPLTETVILASGRKCTPSRSPTGKCVGFSSIECQ